MLAEELAKPLSEEDQRWLAARAAERAEAERFEIEGPTATQWLAGALLKTYTEYQQRLAQEVSGD